MVFTGPDDSPLDGRTVSQRFKNVLAGAGLPSVRLHELRHSAASLMLAGNVPISTVSNVLGHSGIAVTMKHYATFFPSVQEAAAQALDRMLG